MRKLVRCDRDALSCATVDPHWILGSGFFGITFPCVQDVILISNSRSHYATPILVISALVNKKPLHARA
jgi:hypothetical protein